MSVQRAYNYQVLSQFPDPMVLFREDGKAQTNPRVAEMFSFAFKNIVSMCMNWEHYCNVTSGGQLSGFNVTIVEDPVGREDGLPKGVIADAYFYLPNVDRHNFSHVHVFFDGGRQGTGEYMCQLTCGQPGNPSRHIGKDYLRVIHQNFNRAQIPLHELNGGQGIINKFLGMLEWCRLKLGAEGQDQTAAGGRLSYGGRKIRKKSKTKKSKRKSNKKKSNKRKSNKRRR